MKHRTIILLLTVLAAAGLWAGCTEDLPAGVSSIFGRVVDPNGAGILDVPVAAVFGTRRVAGAPAPGDPSGSSSALETFALEPPFPNPSIDPEGQPVVITVTSPTDTTGRVEIWGVVGGVSFLIKTLVQGAIAAGPQTFTWNGQYETGVSIPNGMYEVRLTVPASGGGVEPQSLSRSILVNRTNLGLFTTQDKYSAISDGDGFYVLEDLPIGDGFTETRADGTVLGSAVVENLVTIYFLDFEYLGGPERVPIGPGESVDVVTELRSVNPAVIFGPGPILSASR